MIEGSLPRPTAADDYFVGKIDAESADLITLAAQLNRYLGELGSSFGAKLIGLKCLLKPELGSPNASFASTTRPWIRIPLSRMNHDLILSRVWKILIEESLGTSREATSPSESTRRSCRMRVG
jgi:hypothetical protein